MINRSWFLAPGSWFSVFLVISMYACNRSPRANMFDHSLSKLVGDDKAGFFRGVSPGDSFTVILQKENEKNLVHQDTVLMKYRITVSDSEYYDVDYVLKDAVVNFIRFDAILPGLDEGDKYTGKLTNYFTKKCGMEPLSEKGALYWESSDSTYVELFDRSDEFGYGMVTIYIYRYKRPIPDNDQFLDPTLFLPV